MTTPLGTERPERIYTIQLMRAIAAAIVALIHQAFAFANNIGNGFGLDKPSGQLAQSAVALFFIVSGYIMVVTSARLYGQPNGRRTFLIKRYLRILPPYWLATLTLVAIYIFLGRPFHWGEVFKSLFFIPYWNKADSIWALPILWVGWTLFYEMLFYTLFALGIKKGRQPTIMLALTGIVSLIICGMIFAPDGPILATPTRPILLIFIVGIVLALMRENGIFLPIWLRITALFGAVFSFVLIPSPEDVGHLNFAYVLWAGTPATCVAITLLSGPLNLPFKKLINELGNISYALYLFHIPIAVFWMWAYQKAFHPTDPWMLFITMFTATLIASWIIYTYIERPMTDWLNARFLTARRTDHLSHKSSVGPL